MDNVKETERPTDVTKAVQQLQKLSAVDNVSERGGKLHDLINVLVVFQQSECPSDQQTPRFLLILQVMNQWLVTLESYFEEMKTLEGLYRRQQINNRAHVH